MLTRIKDGLVGYKKGLDEEIHTFANERPDMASTVTIVTGFASGTCAIFALAGAVSGNIPLTSAAIIAGGASMYMGLKTGNEYIKATDEYEKDE